MPSHRSSASVAILLAMVSGTLLAATLSPAQAAPTGAGVLDPSFSPSAPAGITDAVAARQFVDVAAQQDGKVVAISDQGGDFFIARFNQDGSPDLSFANTGTGSVAVDVGAAGQADQALALAIDSQNRIVVVGSGGAAVADFALVRLAPDGKSVQLNTHVHVGNVADPSVPRDVAFQSDGTILAAGTAKVGGDTDFAFVRFHAASGAVIGAPVTASLGTGDETGRGVAVYPSGPNVDKIVIVGNTGTAGDTAMGIIQRNADGTLDGTFNSGQTIVDPTAGNDVANGVAITSSGSILVAGSNGAADMDLVLTQLLPSGPADVTFNAGAVRTIAKPGADAARNHPLAVQADGRIVVVGDSAAALDAGVFRLNADGTTDTSFGAAGDATFNVNGNDDANAVSLDASGNILVAGDEGSSAGFVARLFGSPDTDGDGVRDPFDACPSAPGTLPNGCVAAPEAVLKGKKVVLDTVLAKKSASAKCPDTATVTVKSKSKDGKIKVSKELKTTTVSGGCRVKGKVNLHAQPKKTAQTKVTVTGKKLKTKRLVAVRV